jgi:hypothetical protein
VYNYARFFGWVQAVEELYRVFDAASARVEEHDSVDPLVPWVLEGKENKDKVRKKNRRGTLEQVEEYVRPVDAGRVSRSHWGPNVFSRLFVCSLLALCLTWATVGGAAIVVWFIPTQCMSFSLVLMCNRLTVNLQVLAAVRVLIYFTVCFLPSSG